MVAPRFTGNPVNASSALRPRALVAIMIACMAIAAPAREPVPVVTGNGYGPFADEGLSNGGLATELVRRVFEEMGRAVDISFQPWPRGYRAAHEGEFAATFPYIRMPYRAQDFYYSDPLFNVNVQIYVAADRGIQELQDLSDKTLCNPLGYAITRDFRQKLEHLTYAEWQPRTMKQCLRMLESRRVDFVIITRRQAQSVLDEVRMKREGLRLLEGEHVSADLHLIVSKEIDGGRALLQSFNETLARLQQAGELEPIRRRHQQD